MPAVAGILCVCGPSKAMLIGKSTPDEVEFLPSYCMVQEFMYEKYISDQQRARFAPLRARLWGYWANVFGRDNYRHIHHYCWGLSNMKRAMEPDDGVDDKYELHRKFNLKNAVGNFDYVLQRTSSDMPIRPEILVNKASCLMLWAKYGSAPSRYEEAKNTLLEAISLKDEYREAYVQLMGLLSRMGDEVNAKRLEDITKKKFGTQ